MSERPGDLVMALPETATIGLSIDAEAPGAFRIPAELAAPFEPDLGPGERLLWVGVSHSRWARPRDGWRGFIVAAGAFLLSAGTLSAFLDPRFAPIGVLCGVIGVLAGTAGTLVLVAASLTAGQRYREGKVLRQVAYAITDRRLIVRRPVSDSQGVEVLAIEPGEVLTVHRLEFPDGTGDVVLALGDAHHGQPLSLAAIDEVRRVETLARQVLLSSPSSILPPGRSPGLSAGVTVR